MSKTEGRLRLERLALEENPRLSNLEDGEMENLDSRFLLGFCSGRTRTLRLVEALMSAAENYEYSNGDQDALDRLNDVIERLIVELPEGLL